MCLSVCLFACVIVGFVVCVMCARFLLSLVLVSLVCVDRLQMWLLVCLLFVCVLVRIFVCVFVNLCV